MQMIAAREDEIVVDHELKIFIDDSNKLKLISNFSLYLFFLLSRLQFNSIHRDCTGKSVHTTYTIQTLNYFKPFNEFEYKHKSSNRTQAHTHTLIEMQMV